MSTPTPQIGTAQIGAAAGYPNLNPASIPAAVRGGDERAKQAYAEGLAFEGVLVNELSRQLAGAMFGGQGTGADAGANGASGAGGAGLLSGAQAYSSLIPQALSGAIMDTGGLGIAQEIAQQLDPSLVAANTAPEQPTARPGASGFGSGSGGVSA